MKKSLTLVALVSLFFFGCDQDSDLTSPEYDLPTQDNIDLYPPGADSIFISINLPPSEIPNLVVSEVIDGNDGGEIEFDYEYQTSEDNTISISAELEIPKGAFDGVKEISMIFNNETATISFYPHIVFNDPVEFEIEYTGIDLSGLNPNSVDIIFQNYDGTIEYVEYDEIIMNVSTGTIEVDDAELTHFSRYGFVN